MTDAKRNIFLSHISRCYEDLGASLQLINNTLEHKQYEERNEDFEVSILFWHTFQVLNKLITSQCYYFMFKDQTLFSESSHIPTLISAANPTTYSSNAFYQVSQSILK